MKRILLFAFALVLSTFASAQSASRFSGSYVLDPLNKFAATPVVAYKVKTFNDVLGKAGFALDLQGTVGLKDSLSVGSALTHTFAVSFNAAREFAPKFDLTVGPWANYTPGKTLKDIKLGIYVGVGIRF